VGDTLFLHKTSHKVTWVSQGGRVSNQIDHIAISMKWRRLLLDVRNMRGADIDSDHHLLIAKIALKIASVSKKVNKASKKYNAQKLMNND
jgi:hypothetical protein